jgi:hypothetical protein
VPQRDAVHEHESEENKRAAHKKRKEQKKKMPVVEVDSTYVLRFS